MTKNEFARFITSEDILQNIFTKLIDNTYHWDSSKCSFDKFMYLRIRKEIKNLVKRESNFIPKDINSFTSDQESNYNDDTIKDKSLTKEDFIAEPDLTSPDKKKEDEFDLTDLMEMALDLFRNSEIEFFVIEEILKNKKPREIAKSLGLTTREVRNTTLRIKRKLWRKE
jgi:RNA polymerase sigma factor (sigma-70 family)